MIFAKLYNIASNPELAPALQEELRSSLLELERRLQQTELENCSLREQLAAAQKEVDILSQSGYLWK